MDPSRGAFSPGGACVDPGAEYPSQGDVPSSGLNPSTKRPITISQFMNPGLTLHGATEVVHPTALSLCGSDFVLPNVGLPKRCRPSDLRAGTGACRPLQHDRHPRCCDETNPRAFPDFTRIPCLSLSDVTKFLSNTFPFNVTPQEAHFTLAQSHVHHRTPKGHYTNPGLFQTTCEFKPWIGQKAWSTSQMGCPKNCLSGLVSLKTVSDAQ